MYDHRRNENNNTNNFNSQALLELLQAFSEGQEQLTNKVDLLVSEKESMSSSHDEHEFIVQTIKDAETRILASLEQQVKAAISEIAAKESVPSSHESWVEKRKKAIIRWWSARKERRLRKKYEELRGMFEEGGAK